MAAVLVPALIVVLVSLAEGGPLPPFNLKCQDNLVGLRQSDLTRQYLFATDEPQPRFSWSVKHTDRSARQSAFQVTVSTSQRFDSVLWDSTKIADTYNTSIRYSGPNLKSGVRYFWKIHWWDHDNKMSESFEMGHFLTGVLDPSDWGKVPWVSAPSEITTAPLFSNSLKIDSNSVKQGTLFISGLGFNKPFVNGVDLNARFDPPIALTPGWTKYEKRVPYSVYDVTEDLKSSDDLKVEVMLGVGWRNTTDYPLKDPGPSDTTPRVLRLRLMVIFANGSIIDVLISDESWDVTSTPIKQDNIYNGELYDATSSVKRTIGKAKQTTGPSGQMYLPQIPPIVEIKTEKPVSIYEHREKLKLISHIVDFGNNSAGYCRINIKGLKNVTLKHAEVPMHPPYGDKDGSLYYGNLRKAQQLDIVLTDGTMEYYKPTFTYHGFRYVEVTGFSGKLSADQIEKIVIHTNVASNGMVETSSKILNAIQAGAVNSQLSNMMSVPTDCDQRDERLGWMGDAGLSAESMMNNFDTKAFHENYLQLIADDFIDHMSLPDVVPYYRYGSRPADPAWGDAFLEILHMLLEKYKDNDLMTSYYDFAAQYILALSDKARSSGIGKLYSYYGDWVPPPGQAKVNGSFVSGFVLLKGLQKVKEFAQFSNKEDDVKLYQDLFDEMFAQFNKTFLNANGTYLMGSQASYVLPLALGLWKQTDDLTKRFMDKFKADKSHITTGIIGAKFIFDALMLTSDGNKLALELAEHVDYPSWGFMYYNKEEPATGMWELWNSNNGSAGMNSRNHHMFSSVSSYIKTQAAGISQPKGSYGFDTIHLKPATTLGLSHAKASFDFPKPVSLSWQRLGGIQCAKTPEDQSPLSSTLPKNGGLEINCGSKGSFVGEILFASFGNPSGQCESSYKINDCHVPNSQKIVEKLCIGKTTCTIPTGIDYWGDPCPLKSKWLTVKAICYNILTKEPEYKYSSINIQASVPVGSKALLFLPTHGKDNFTVWESNKLVFASNILRKTIGILYSQWHLKTNSLILTLESGDYNFIAHGDMPKMLTVEASEDGVLELKCKEGEVIGSVDENGVDDKYFSGGITSECLGKTSCQLSKQEASISFSCAHLGL